MPKQISIMGVNCRVTNRQELLEKIKDGKMPVRVATLNPEFMLEAEQNPAFRDALEGMTNCVIDGFGLYALLGRKDIDRYPGANLVNDLFRTYADGGKRIFLLGGLGNEAVLASKTLAQRYPNLEIVGAESGGNIIVGQPLDLSLLKRIQDSQADIVLVGFGAPKQELWIQAAASSSIPVMIGVGGSFGFYSTKRRAPKLLQQLKLEWLYRGLSERGHWRRVWRAVVIFPIHFFRFQLKNG